MQEKPVEVNMDQASEYDTESEPEEDENVSAQESSQEVGGKNRELISFYGSENTIGTYHKNVI